MLTNKKLVASCSVLTLTCLSFVLFSGCTPSGPRAVLDGARLLRDGRPDQAVARLQEGVRLLPKNAQAWNYLGLAYHRNGRPADAAKAYQQALVLDRDLSAARFNLGCLYLDEGNPAGAVAELTTYTALRPNSPAGWSRLGTAQWRTRQPDAAERSFAQSLKLDAASPDALNGLGLIMIQRRRYPEALNQFNAALRIQADYAPALLNAAIVSHQNLNNRPAALQRYREYVALKPAPPNAVAVRELAERLEAELRPVPRPPNTNVSASLALTSQRTDPVPAAARSQPPPSTNKVSPPQSSESNSIPNPLALALHAGPVTTSAPPAKVAIATAPASNQTAVTTVPPPKTLDVVQVPREEPLQPARDAPAVVSNRTSTADAERLKPAPAPITGNGQTLSTPSANPVSPPASKSKQPQAFIKKLNPVNWFRSNKSGEKTTTTQGSGSAPETAATAVRMEQSAAPSSARPEKAASATGGFGGPRYKYRSLQTPTPGRRAEAEKWLTEGVKARERNRLNDAVDAFGKATAADPSLFEAHYNLGVAEFEAGDSAKALLAYEQALAIAPGSMKARYNFAVALEKSGYLQDAANELERVIATNPTEAAAHLALANLYSQRAGELGKARQHYLRFLELQPKSPQATSIRYWLEAHP